MYFKDLQAGLAFHFVNVLSYWCMPVKSTLQEFLSVFFSIKIFACWVILHAFLSFVDFLFVNSLVQKNPSEIPSECQTVWIQIRPNVLLA